MSPTPAPTVHAFTTKFPGRVRRITTEVHVSAGFDVTKQPAPTGPVEAVQALWDTGATASVITKSTALALGLHPTGKAKVSHAGGEQDAYTYIVSIGLPNGLGIPAMPVIECEDAAGAFGVIVGMDVITAGDLSISNVNNQTWMTFRMPSVEAVDFVDQIARQNARLTGRNDPCHCGSGKKFKRCCGK